MMIPPGCWVSTQTKANTFSGTDSSTPGGELFPPQQKLHLYCGLRMCPSAQANYVVPQYLISGGHLISASPSVNVKPDCFPLVVFLILNYFPIRILTE